MTLGYITIYTSKCIGFTTYILVSLNLRDSVIRKLNTGRADEKLEALKHYFGITYSKELVTRGIETRRHDTPNFIKQFQTELLYTLFDCDNSAEIYDKTLEEALLCITKTIDKVMTREIESGFGNFKTTSVPRSTITEVYFLT